ncbi:hypothetical protein CJP72_14670 [Citrobacter sp. NCU1]|uniref:DeoR/GlpR family DNA-binding transcription regulator n=1 Tax=Citrobacter sp. NCU1 TaxID=2026683 RepID=UPI001390ED30|nr:DeoR/GlpR family DNA-binding transcription regulator [Citrobacter sp. NCU1]NDO81960.1 hypothetical protein [Citrobacter sp. NCU1]
MNDKKIHNAPRLNKILAIIEEHGACSQDELAKLFDVSVQTIRRDFATLRNSNLINVKSGVAYINHADTIINTDFSMRQTTHMAEKEAIALRIARDIQDGSTIFLTAGTTIEKIAAALLNKKDLTVITSSIRVANILCSSETINVFIPKGKIRNNNGAIIGSSVVEDISQFHADYTITSVGAITEEGVLLEYNIDDVAIARTMIGQSEKLIVATDYSKFSRKAAVVLCKPSSIDAIYCDQYPSAELQRTLEDNGVIFNKVDVLINIEGVDS